MRAGQRRHRGGRALRAGQGRRGRRAGRARATPRTSTWWSSGRRRRWSPGSPIGCAARGVPVFGCSRAAARDRGLQGVRQGADGAPRRSRPRRSARSPTRRGRAVHRRLAASAARSAWSSRPTGSPPARAWSSCDERGGGARPRCAACSSAAPRRRRPARGHRGVPRRARGLADGARRRRARDAAAAAPRITRRIFDGDRGPKTGGMGMVSPTPVIDAISRSRARCARCSSRPRAAASPTGGPTAALLYAGLMLDARAGRRCSSSTAASAIPRRRC